MTKQMLKAQIVASFTKSAGFSYPGDAFDHDMDTEQSLVGDQYKTLDSMREAHRSASHKSGLKSALGQLAVSLVPIGALSTGIIAKRGTKLSNTGLAIGGLSMLPAMYASKAIDRRREASQAVSDKAFAQQTGPIEERIAATLQKNKSKLSPFHELNERKYVKGEDFDYTRMDSDWDAMANRRKAT